MGAGVAAVQVLEAEVYVGDGVPEGDDCVVAAVAVVVTVKVAGELDSGGAMPGSASPTRVQSESGWDSAARRPAVGKRHLEVVHLGRPACPAVVSWSPKLLDAMVEERESVVNYAESLFSCLRVCRSSEDASGSVHQSNGPVDPCRGSCHRRSSGRRSPCRESCDNGVR